MEERQIYQLASGKGYLAVVNGNFVTVKFTVGAVYACVEAFLQDTNTQVQRFDDAGEAVAWAFSLAENYVGNPSPHSTIERWESRHCYAVTAKREESGQYLSEVFPMWVDSEHYPDVRIPTSFPTAEEAMEYGRGWADREMEDLTELKQDLLRLRGAMGAGDPWPVFVP